MLYAIRCYHVIELILRGLIGQACDLVGDVAEFRLPRFLSGHQLRAYKVGSLLCGTLAELPNVLYRLLGDSVSLLQWAFQRRINPQTQNPEP